MKILDITRNATQQRKKLDITREGEKKFKPDKLCPEFRLHDPLNGLNYSMKTNQFSFFPSEFPI